ncbi:Cytochrome c-type biogenesis protein CcmH precursor [Vibrio mediterranei]|uniref:Cytochrome c-type biogenesis protein n=1 Tax=Vibrio mediterranei TaxID=689 RepID=A0ABX5D9V9_9VIBR|nr:cytochrome c-type biogenesis protein [Vibrio mediterranei]PCD88810.1 cytochrome c-type biogenesis protein CcmH [Vibrio mediterranei]PRQ66409.1 cytochrome c-type biogenesis protein CcmH [Vibrio mediterranei]PTC03466.1 cytochrome c-type biogenesis protein CcmH [Vibrio mediterranei]SBO09654.1 Cytochrome c-type biogenesis protein CcmH precursor [Vibrio mediterranei]
MKKWLIALASSLVLALAANAAIEVHEFDSLEQENQFKELNHTLRCPKCQNNTIGDSNAELAVDLRQKVYEMTKEGKSKQEIIDYMIARYGNFVTYNPPLTFATAILWVGPLFVVVFGFGLIVMRSRKNRVKQTEQAGSEWSDEKEAQLKALLDEKETGDKQ